MLVAAVLSVAAATMAVADGADCKINIQNDIDKQKDPLILKIIESESGRKSFDWIWPTVVNEKQGELNIKENEKLLFACLGERNSFLASKNRNPEKTVTGTCLQGNIIVNGVTANKKNYLACKSAVASSVENTKQPCDDNNHVGTKFLMGFKLPPEQNNQFLELVKVCYNSAKMITYYTRHELPGKSIDGAIHSSKIRPLFRVEPKDIFSGRNPDKALNCKNQNETLNAILGAGADKEYIVKQKVYIVRGHLSPHADFIFNSGSQMTYYIINAAPQWQNFNSHNWFKVEKYVRSLASAEGTSLIVWTGTYGVMKLRSTNDGIEKEIYMLPEQSPQQPAAQPVPEIFWKLVQNPSKGSCIVAVGHNNVHLNAITPICDHAGAGWQRLDTKDNKNGARKVNKGFVYFCAYENFKRVVSYVPNVTCTQLLRYPSNLASASEKGDDPRQDSTDGC